MCNYTKDLAHRLTIAERSTHDSIETNVLQMFSELLGIANPATSDDADGDPTSLITTCN